jgi:hypothetical protein
LERPSAGRAKPRMPEPERTTDLLARKTSRRGLLARVGRALVLAAGGSAVSAAVAPGEAEGFHFCGHIFTTDSCPHPTGLPRVDARGFPLRARDGKPVDNLGRRVDRFGRPVNERGQLFTDPEGQPLPPAPRTRVCLDQIPERFGLRVWVDGAWYRCCGGRVRKLSDCCSYSPLRFNGDAALVGYCYAGRRVFCVQYIDTKVPC